jgi:o-succinylbenzoate---CoA ligase
MRPLRTVSPGPDVLPALRDALAGGDAVFVGAAAGLPATVEQRVALVVETSGSSGRPKRVALSADALLANAAASESAFGGPGQWLLALPTHYIAGLNVLIRSLAAGTEPVTVAGEHFTAAGFLEAVERMSSPDRFTSLVPAQLAVLLDDPAATAALAGFRRVLVGGQAMPKPLRKRALDAFVPVVRSYGSSETSGGCVYDHAPIGQTEVRLVDDEVQLGGPSIAEGYLGDPELTADRFVEDAGMRWFRTADEGTWDGEHLVIAGRRDDVIISGGLKVSLGAVERILHEHGFEDAVVVKGQDAKWGEVPVAFTAKHDDSAPAVAAIEAALGPAARPRMRSGSAIPYLAVGKPDRVSLQQKANE